MRIFRTMLVNPTDRLPAVGTADMQLGARVPADVRPVDGVVHPIRPNGRAQGMSVSAEEPLQMNPRFIPERLGGSALEGEIFETEGATIVAPLALRADRPPHHVVGPASPMPVANYQDALAATRDAWRIWS